MNRPSSILMLLCACAATAACAGGFRIADGGRAECAIVRAADAPKADVFAAEELQLHLKLATGADFRIVCPGEAGPCRTIELGTPRAVAAIGADRVRALREEECIYVVRGDVVAIAGCGRAGLCYGVYSFLERELGARWFNQEDDPYVPRRAATLDVPEGEHREMPRLPYRMLHSTLTMRHADSREMLFYFRNRINQLDGNYWNVCESLKGRLPVRIKEISPGCHTLFLYLPPDHAGQRAPGYISELTNGYFAAHPDWYSLSKDGKRVKNRQLCFANREMRAELTRRIFERIEAKGGEGFFDCSAQDVPDEFCYCDGCQALVRRYGSRGAPLFDFLHELAPKVKAKYPKALLHFLVYRKEQTQRPPVGFGKWPDNLAAVFAPIDNDFSKNYLHPNNADSYDDLKKWCSLVKTWEWYYTFVYGASFAPTPGLKRTAEDIRLSVDAGLVGGYVEHDVGTYQGVNFADAETWMLTQHYRDPNRDWRELRKEFFDYAYGAASRDMVEYSDMLERKLEELPSLLTWDGGFPGRFGRKDLEGLHRRFDAAERKVAGDPLVLQRVREARFGLDVMSVSRDWPDAGAAYARATNTLMKAVARRYTAPKISAQYTRQFSRGALDMLKTRRFLATVTVKPLPAEFDGIAADRIEQVFPLSGRKNYTEYIDDAAAATGHAVREPLKPGKKRPSPYPAGFYDKSSRTFILSAKIPESEWGHGEYKFHRLGRVPMPSANCIVWFGTSWAMSFSAGKCYRPGSDDRWDVWASLRFEDDGAVVCDRVVFVRVVE